MHVAGRRWQALFQLLGFLQMLHRCHCMSMDEIIAGAMESPKGFDFIYDEASNTVRVDMDMLYSKQDWDMLQMLNESSIGVPGKRQAINPGAGGGRWTSQTVPYEIDSRAFQGQHVQVLQNAMNDWMKYTCINFRPATASDTHKIKFVDGDGCASYVGMQSSKKQDVLLATGCRYKGTVIHELGHALGLHHEQTRPDRDEYVKIHKENIPDHLEYNFQKYSWSVIQNLNVPYDYTSIMHYGKTYFAEDKSKPTIETIDPSAQNVIGNRAGLSFRDIKTMNLMYECHPPNCNLRNEQCKGEGFVGKDCKCWCPAEVSKSGDPYVLCSSTSGSGNQGGSTGGDTGGNTGGNNWGNQGSNTGQGTVCDDRNVNCMAWASRGECTASKTYMESYCKKSCNRCGSSAVMQNQCKDLHWQCNYWARSGHCRDGYAVIVGATCKQSCGLCNNYGQAYDQQECKDEHQYCAAWAYQGHCVSQQYSQYMSLTCRRSCNLCQSDYWSG